MLKAEVAEKCHQALDFESLDLFFFFFFRVSMQGPCFTALEEDGDDERLVQLELAARGRNLVRGWYGVNDHF